MCGTTWLSGSTLGCQSMDLGFDLRHSPGCTGGNTLGWLNIEYIYNVYWCHRPSMQWHYHININSQCMSWFVVALSVLWNFDKKLCYNNLLPRDQYVSFLYAILAFFSLNVGIWAYCSSIIYNLVFLANYQ